MRTTGRLAGLAVAASAAFAPLAQANPYPPHENLDERRGDAPLILVVGVLVGVALLGIAYLRRKRWRLDYLRERYRGRRGRPPR